MTEIEDFVISEPYQPTENEKRAIGELEDKDQGLVVDDWDSRKTYIKSFKENLREDMYKKQNELCAYCRIHVPLSCVPMHREHIVYKNDHPQWMFLPENLCIACPLCNEYKGEAEVLANPKTKKYPNNSRGFKIIHPLYDRYSEHIELIGGILYRGKTNKGRYTIETCHLYRVALAEERVTHIKIEENKGSIIAGLMQLLKQSEKYVDDNNKFIQRVTKIVSQYKENQRLKVERGGNARGTKIK